MKMIRTTSGKSKKHLRSFFKTILSSQIFEGSAALSYYLLFSMFPLLIFISAAFSTLNLDPVNSTRFLRNVLPDQVMSMIQEYLKDLSSIKGPLMLIGIVLTIYSLGKAVEVLKRRIRRAYQSEPKINAVMEWIVSLVFVLLLLASVYGTLIIVVAGDHLFSWLMDVSILSNGSFSLFRQFRMLLVGIFILFVLFGIYYVLPAVDQKPREALPGAFFSLFSWVVSSWLFSYYVNHLNDFSTLYGSLGTIIILMIWFYLFNFILLMGAHINAHLYRIKREVNL